ncbi:MAG: YbaN family protein [Spirochaetales bacterium]|nr:YbaN family protein [Spirochaetales bacterium]
MKKVFLIIAGNISLSLGVAGIFLPVLPTTPFLLLSAACFLRSSDKLYYWLTHHRIFGNYIQGYVKYKAISLRAKVISITALWLVIGSTIIFFISSLWIRILLILIAVGVTFYLVSIKTLTQKMIEDLKKDKEKEIKSSQVLS